MKRTKIPHQNRYSYPPRSLNDDISLLLYSSSSINISCSQASVWHLHLKFKLNRRRLVAHANEGFSHLLWKEQNKGQIKSGIKGEDRGIQLGQPAQFNATCFQEALYHRRHLAGHVEDCDGGDHVLVLQKQTLVVCYLWLVCRCPPPLAWCCCRRSRWKNYCWPSIQRSSLKERRKSEPIRAKVKYGWALDLLHELYINKANIISRVRDVNIFIDLTPSVSSKALKLISSYLSPPVSI